MNDFDMHEGLEVNPLPTYENEWFDKDGILTIFFHRFITEVGTRKGRFLGQIINGPEVTYLEVISYGGFLREYKWSTSVATPAGENIIRKGIFDGRTNVLTITIPNCTPGFDAKVCAVEMKGKLGSDWEILIDTRPRVMKNYLELWGRVPMSGEIFCKMISARLATVVGNNIPAWDVVAIGKDDIEHYMQYHFISCMETMAQIDDLIREGEWETPEQLYRSVFNIYHKNIHEGRE